MKKIFRIAFMLGLMISISATVVSAVNSYTNRGQGEMPQYEVNENGQTYGPGVYAVSVETEPDLISAVGIDGTEGYVYSKDLQEEMPQTPEEAVDQTKELRKSQNLTRDLDGTIVVDIIPLYDIDGKTVIGKFAITNTPFTDSTLKWF